MWLLGSACRSLAAALCSRSGAKMYDSHPQDAEQELQERGAKVTIGHHPETAGRRRGRFSRGWGRRSPMRLRLVKGKANRWLSCSQKPPFKYSGSERVRVKVVVWGPSKQQLWLIYYLMRPPSTAHADTGFSLSLWLKIFTGCAAYHLMCLTSDFIGSLVILFFDAMKMTEVKKKRIIPISNMFQWGYSKKDAGPLNWLTHKIARLFHCVRKSNIWS